MNKIFSRSHLTPFEADYARWCAEQGELLRAGRVDALDRQNLAEEIESLGRSDKREIESRLKPLLVHHLKWKFQADRRPPSWRATISEQRSHVARILKESPSLKSYPGEVLAEEYEFARWDAASETGLPVEIFPDTCPFSIKQVLDADYLPE